MAYYKSHSNYVLKSHHQNIDDGIIYERDFTTIGGLNQFAKGEIPIYKSGNFIVTNQNTIKGNKDYENNDWLISLNGQSNIWKGEDLINASINSDNCNIQLNQDYYVLKDFAYYGSCNELIRTSIIHIINSFPGELYSPYIIHNDAKIGLTVYYTDVNTKERLRLGTEDEFLLDNPFQINLHASNTYANENVNKLKYFCNLGYKNYVIIIGESHTNELIETYNVEWHINENETCILPGVKIATITLNDAYIISAYMGDNNKIIYLTSNIDIHIRPLSNFYDDFYTNLSLFEKILMNKNSTPIYTATFEITQETEYGYQTTLQNFTFPLSYGNYNIGVGNAAYEEYLNTLSNIAIFYDDVFCNNLYRSMTHESIKNFDWTDSNNADTIEFSKNKIKKLIHLFGCEFDKLKTDIDNLKHIYDLSYHCFNYPTNVLSNMLLNDGWVSTPIQPFKIMNDKIVSDNDFNIQPYSVHSTHSCYPLGYFINTSCDDTHTGNTDSYKTPANETDGQFKVINNTLRGKIQEYSSNTVYNLNDINNIFLKNLKLNSKNIFRHKSCIEGIEMILALFGLKSKRLYDLSFNDFNGVKSPKNSRYLHLCDNTSTHIMFDYDITEYVAYTNAIVDKWDENNNMFVIDKYNKYKTIPYNTPQYKNGIYLEYQGLPVKFYDESDIRYLVPYFNQKNEIDGDPYYQMFGGWMWKSKSEHNNTLVNGIYTNTIKEIFTVQNIKELLSLPYNKLYDKIVYKVLNLNGNYVIANGELFDLKTEYRNGTSYRYFSVTCNNGQINIGDNYYNNTISISYELNPLTHEINEKSVDLNSIPNGTEINIYEVNGDFTIHDAYFSRDDYFNKAIINTIIFDKNIITNVKNGTQYFQLNKKNEHNILSLRNTDKMNGWVRLLTTDQSFKDLSYLQNNYLGNNPHNGNFKYDDGSAYIGIYSKLFNYAIDNKTINFNCFPDKTRDEVLCEYDKFGFVDIHKRIKSNKIEYFGNLFYDKGNSTVTKIYSNIIHSKNEYNLSNADLYPQYANLGIKVGFTEQIINTKYIDITFYTEKDDLAFIKFMDNIILPYLQQLIPSNAIIRIIYKEIKAED